MHLLPNGFSTPTTTTLAFMKAGYSVRFEPIDAEQRTGTSKIKLARDGAKFFLILLKIITIFSPLKIFVPVAAVTFAVGSLVWTVDDLARIARRELVSAADHPRRDYLSRGPRLGADLGAAIRTTAVRWEFCCGRTA